MIIIMGDDRRKLADERAVIHFALLRNYRAPLLGESKKVMYTMGYLPTSDSEESAFSQSRRIFRSAAQEARYGSHTASLQSIAKSLFSVRKFRRPRGVIYVRRWRVSASRKEEEDRSRISAAHTWRGYTIEIILTDDQNWISAPLTPLRGAGVLAAHLLALPPPTPKPKRPQI